MKVVGRDSAVIDGSHEIGFDVDHRGLQRISSPEDQRYKDILGWIRKWIDHSEQSLG